MTADISCYRHTYFIEFLDIHVHHESGYCIIYTHICNNNCTYVTHGNAQYLFLMTYDICQVSEIKDGLKVMRALSKVMAHGYYALPWVTYEQLQ